MAETLTIRTASSTEVVKIAVPGPQGPKGDKGDPGDVAGLPLSTLGDTLYRGASENQRLPIGTSGQILRVSAGGIPEWGAAPATGVTSVALASTDLTITGSPITTSGTITANIAANAVTLEKLQTISSEHLLGRHGNGNGGVQQIGLGTGLAISGSNVGVTFGSSAGTACQGNDSRLSDSRQPLSHAASHASAGSDPLAPSDIGAQSIFVTQTIISATTLTAQRARIYEVMNFGAAYTITMPSTNNIAGDVIVFRSVNVISNTVTISNPLGNSSTLTATDQQYRYIYSTVGGGSWQNVPVDTHTHAASAITSGTLAHERGGLEADVSAYNGLVKISGGSTSAVTVTSAGEALLDDADAAAQRTTLGLGTAAVEAASAFAQASHTHELTALAATGATNGHVLTANGSNGATFAALPASGVTGAAASASDVLGVSGANITGVDATADRIVFWDDSASALKYLEAGSGLSISGTTLTATASGGSKTYAVFTAEHNQPPSTAFATLDTRNSIAVLDFDDATDESAVFVSIIPEGASLGSGLKIRLHWMATTATSGNVVWDVSLERMNTDLDSDSFDTIASATAAANGTSGILTVTEITLTTIDSVTAGDGFRLKVTRDANNASDTMTGDAELVVCEVRSAA